MKAFSSVVASSVVATLLLSTSYLAYAEKTPQANVADSKVVSECHALLNFKASKLRSNEVIDFCKEFNGKALLVVNTASKCGYTKQFKGLESLHKHYGSQLAVVGFPSDDFRQEHKDQEQVAEVCYINYGVTFTMLEPSSVTGDNANDLFKSLSAETGKSPGWNFSKYLVSADGKNIQHFASGVRPNNKKLIKAIEASF